MALVNFYNTSLSAYSALANKDTNALYFLDNGQLYKGAELISNVHTIYGSFPSQTDSSMLENYYISLETGEMRYVDSEGNYISLSELMTHNIVLSESNIKALINKIAENKTITMPSFRVSGDTLQMVNSNVTEITVMTPVQGD